MTGIDPKGVYKRQPGVVGNARAMAGAGPVYADAQPTIIHDSDVTQAATAPALPKSIGLSSIANSPEARAAIPTTVAAFTGALTDNDYVKMAVAFIMCVGAVVAAFYFIKRIRSQ